mmetsp:Transcript_79668/g.234362  ORF Transcript_79668/g.234362 Transcript_79668/m.234362 type:complete len:314 (-) Transcript_79668:1272-2213(-)
MYRRPSLPSSPSRSSHRESYGPPPGRVGHTLASASSVLATARHSPSRTRTSSKQRRPWGAPALPSAAARSSAAAAVSAKCGEEAEAGGLPEVASASGARAKPLRHSSSADSGEAAYHRKCSLQPAAPCTRSAVMPATSEQRVPAALAAWNGRRLSSYSFSRAGQRSPSMRSTQKRGGSPRSAASVPGGPSSVLTRNGHSPLWQLSSSVLKAQLSELLGGARAVGSRLMRRRRLASSRSSACWADTSLHERQSLSKRSTACSVVLGESTVSRQAALHLKPKLPRKSTITLPSPCVAYTTPIAECSPAGAPGGAG